MKIISWNCNMAFRKKYVPILKLKPDLLILQECENGDKLRESIKDIPFNQLIWHGNNQHKGVAAISFNETTITKTDNHHLDFEYVIPLKIKTHNAEINLFSVWAMPHKSDRQKNYVGQVWGAINHYSNELNKKTIIIGDLNSNAIWDKKYRVGNHSDVVAFLSKRNIHSIYHRQEKEKHGKEKQPTFYLTKKLEKPYHLDYCFATEELINNNTSIRVGKYKQWIELSDHMPIIIEHLNI